MESRYVVRAGGPGDSSVLLALFDDSIAWMVERGLTAQWGAIPFSMDPKRIAACERWCETGEVYVCEVDGRPAAALVLADPPDHIEPSQEPEVYVLVLVGSHKPFARGAGAHLLKRAEEIAGIRGVERLRVDCFAGNGGTLVDFYRRCGYTPLGTFSVDGWAGQILERRLGDGPSAYDAARRT